MTILELDLESLARDLDLSNLQILLEHDSSGEEEDEDLDLENPNVDCTPMDFMSIFLDEECFF